MKILATTAAVLLLTACTSPHKATTMKSPSNCSDLAGRPVGRAVAGKLGDWQLCSIDGLDVSEPGSASCYRGGKPTGLLFYLHSSQSTFYGVPGGTWQAGPPGMTETDMANQINC